MSAGKKYDTKKTTAEGAFNNFVVRLSWKVLVDGNPSVNLVPISNVCGTNSWNFFKESSTNVFQIREHLHLVNKLIAISFSQATDFISSVGIKEYLQFLKMERKQNR